MISFIFGVRVQASPTVKPPMAMVPMEQIGPQPRSVDLNTYAHVVHVAPAAKYRTVGDALALVRDASPTKRYAILVAAGNYKETRIRMKPHVDLYGGFASGDWKSRDVYQHATILGAQQKGPVVIAADHSRLDGFVVTGGEHKAHGGGVL